MIRGVFAQIERYVRYAERHDGYWVCYDNLRHRGAVLISKEDWVCNKSECRTQRINICLERGEEDASV